MDGSTPTAAEVVRRGTYRRQIGDAAGAACLPFIPGRRNGGTRAAGPVPSAQPHGAEPNRRAGRASG